MSWTRRTLPAVLLAAAILAMSGPAGSGEVTGSLAHPFLASLGLSGDAIAALHHLLRKVGHFTAYGLFAWLALRAVRGEDPVTGRAVGAAAALAVLLAAADEGLQRLSPARTSSALDVAIDVVGAVAALALASRLSARRGEAATPAGGGPG